MAKNYDIVTIKKAIKKSGGFYSVIGKRLGCSWNTARTHVEKHKDTIEALQEEKESILDLAESKLIENINDNDNKAIEYYLNKQGGKRGYAPNNKDIEISINKQIFKIGDTEIEI